MEIYKIDLTPLGLLLFLSLTLFPPFFPFFLLFPPPAPLLLLSSRLKIPGNVACRRRFPPGKQVNPTARKTARVRNGGRRSALPAAAACLKLSPGRILCPRYPGNRKPGRREEERREEKRERERKRKETRRGDRQTLRQFQFRVPDSL